MLSNEPSTNFCVTLPHYEVCPIDENQDKGCEIRRNCDSFVRKIVIYSSVAAHVTKISQTSQLHVCRLFCWHYCVSSVGYLNWFALVRRTDSFLVAKPRCMQRCKNWLRHCSKASNYTLIEIPEW